MKDRMADETTYEIWYRNSVGQEFNVRAGFYGPATPRAIAALYQGDPSNQGRIYFVVKAVTTREEVS